LTPVLVALLIGVGVQTTTGVASGLADGPARAVGTALPGVLLILVSCFAPLALFRLLAFVDPATPAGVQVRQAVGDLLQVRSLLTQPGFTPPGDGSTTGTPGQDPADQRRGEAQDQLDSIVGQTDPSAPSGPPATMPSSASQGAGAVPSGGASPPPGGSSSTPSGTAPSGSTSSGPSRTDEPPRWGGAGSGSNPGASSGGAGAGAAGGGSAAGSVAGEAAALPVVPV